MGTSGSIEKLQQALAELSDTTGGEDALAALDAARRLRDLAEAAEDAQVRAARDEGIAWSKIGKLYGLTKQGAQQRFRRSRDAKA